MDDSRALLTTGEIAGRCGVSVRTVQYYDSQDLLKPSQLSEGGRRLYSLEDLQQLQLICLLRSLGLSISSIRGVLSQEHPEKSLLLLLDEQEQQIQERTRDDQKLLALIREVRKDLQKEGDIPRKSRKDLEQDIQGKRRMRILFRTMLALGIILDVIEIGTIVWWIRTGQWLPFVICLACECLVAIPLVKVYYREVAYLCPECQAKFKPQYREFLFSKHTRTMRKLTCTECGTKGWCVETYADPR